MKYMLALTLLLLVSSAHASEISIDIWGASYHTDRAAGFNESNIGLGVTVDGNYTLGQFRDSMGDMSSYIGYKEYFGHFGYAAFAMHRPSYGKPILAVIPMVRIGSFNFIYLPNYNDVKEAISVHYTIEIGGE